MYILEYKLDEGQWYILLSTGEVNDVRGTSYHGPSNQGKAISSDRLVRFSSTEPHVFFGSTKSSTVGLKAHAIIMVIAWSLLAPLG